MNSQIKTEGFLVSHIWIAKAPPQLKVLSRGDSLDDIYSISNVIEK